MIVLKIIGFVLLAVITLVVLILCVKVRIFAEYSETDTRVRLQWLFIKIPLYPSEKEKSQNKQNDKKNSAEQVTEAEQNSTVSKDKEDNIENTEAAEEQQAQEDGTSASDEIADTSADGTQPVKQKNNLLKTLYNAHGIDGLLLIVQRVFSYLGTFIGDLMHSLVIDELYLDVRCTKKDAASTAIYYGQVCSALFPLMGALVSKYKVRKYDINVYPDFLAKQSSASFAVSMHLYPIYLIGITLVFGCRMIFKVLLRLIVKCFLPSKNKEAENANKDGAKTSESKI